MERMAVHMRISSVAISDDEVTSRRSASGSLAIKWGKETNVNKIVSKAAEIAEALGGDGQPSSALGNEIQAAIQKKSPAYLYEERPLDISVCAGMAMLSNLGASRGTGDWLITDVYAAALWSALAYQPVLEADRREDLRREVLNAAAIWSTNAAEKVRTRQHVPDPLEVKITVDDNKVASSNFREAMSNTVEALRRNAALDREELDFLWWAQLGRSRLLNRQLSTIGEPTRILAAGIEAASLLRRLPCEVHREIVLRTLDQNPELNLEGMIAAIGDDRTALGAPYIEGCVAAHPTIFPLLHALATGEVNRSGSASMRSVSEWGERALLEAGFARMMSQGVIKI